MRWFILIPFVAVVTLGCSSSNPQSETLTEIISTVPESNDSIWIVTGMVWTTMTDEPLIAANVIVRYGIEDDDSLYMAGVGTDINGKFLIPLKIRRRPAFMTLYTEYLAHFPQCFDHPNEDRSPVWDLDTIVLMDDPHFQVPELLR